MLSILFSSLPCVSNSEIGLFCYVVLGFVGFRDEYHVGFFKSIGKIACGQ